MGSAVAACAGLRNCCGDGGRRRCRRAWVAGALLVLLALLSPSLTPGVAGNADNDFESDWGSYSRPSGITTNHWSRGMDTPSWGTGPAVAHTGIWFAFLETSYPARRGDVSYLTTPALPAGTRSVGFAYHMYGDTMGTLSLEVLNAGNWTTVFTRTGQQSRLQTTPWTFLAVALPDGSKEARFKGVTGSSYRSDMAVDSVQFSSTFIPTCVCDNGIAANGGSCPVDGANICLSCKAGYERRVDESDPRATRSYCEVAKTVSHSTVCSPHCSRGLSFGATYDVYSPF